MLVWYSEPICLFSAGGSSMDWQCSTAVHSRCACRAKGARHTDLCCIYHGTVPRMVSLCAATYWLQVRIRQWCARRSIERQDSLYDTCLLSSRRTCGLLKVAENEFARRRLAVGNKGRPVYPQLGYIDRFQTRLVLVGITS